MPVVRKPNNKQRRNNAPSSPGRGPRRNSVADQMSLARFFFTLILFFIYFVIALSAFDLSYNYLYKTSSPGPIHGLVESTLLNLYFFISMWLIGLEFFTHCVYFGRISFMNYTPGSEMFFKNWPKLIAALGLLDFAISIYVACTYFLFPYAIYRCFYVDWTGCVVDMMSLIWLPLCRLVSLLLVGSYWKASNRARRY